MWSITYANLQQGPEYKFQIYHPANILGIFNPNETLVTVHPPSIEIEKSIQFSPHELPMDKMQFCNVYYDSINGIINVKLSYNPNGPIGSAELQGTFILDVLGCQNEQYRVVASFLIKLVQDESNDLIRDVEREHQPLLLPSKKITDNYYSYLDDVPVVSYYGRRKVRRSKDEEKVSTPEELYEKWSSMPEERNTPTEPFLGMGIDHLVPKNSAFDMENEVVDLPRRK